MNKIRNIFSQSQLLVACTGALVLSGCANIGKPEFTCSGVINKDGVCAGPMDVYALTNNRENLENLTLEELDAQVNGDNHQGYSHTSDEETSDDDVIVYKTRSKEQHTPSNYQKPEVVPQTRFESAGSNGFDAWPNNGEPLAPEAMAMMSQPMPMRILVTAYKDEMGTLNMPGYIYVDIKPQTWQFGNDANIRPSRVVPMTMRKKSETELNKVRQRSKGVDGLGIENPID